MTACLHLPGSSESLGQKALPTSCSLGVLWQCLAPQCSRWEGISGLQAPGALLASGSRMVQVGARTLSLVRRAKRTSRTSAPDCPTVLLGQDPRCAAEPRGVLTRRNESLAPRNEEHFLGPRVGGHPLTSSVAGGSLLTWGSRSPPGQASATSVGLRGRPWEGT